MVRQCQLCPKKIKLKDPDAPRLCGKCKIAISIEHKNIVDQTRKKRMRGKPILVV